MTSTSSTRFGGRTIRFRLLGATVVAIVGCCTAASAAEFGDGADRPGGAGDSLVFAQKQVAWASQVPPRSRVTDLSAPRSGDGTGRTPRQAALITGKRAVVVIDGVVHSTQGEMQNRSPSAVSNWRLVENGNGKRRWYVRAGD